MPEELSLFFQSYQDGWDAFSGDAIASHYRMPVSIIDGDGLRSYTEQEDLISKFEANCIAFQQLGYRRAKFHVGYFRQNSEISATIDLGWRIYLEAGERDFRTTYMCAKVDKTWSIISAVAYEGSYNDGDT